MWPDWAIFCTLGNFFNPLATINLPRSVTFLGNFRKGVKILNFSSEIIFGQLKQTFGDFYLVTLVSTYVLRYVCMYVLLRSWRDQNTLFKLKRNFQKPFLIFFPSKGDAIFNNLHFYLKKVSHFFTLFDYYLQEQDHWRRWSCFCCFNTIGMAKWRMGHSRLAL